MTADIKMFQVRISVCCLKNIVPHTTVTVMFMDIDIKKKQHTIECGLIFFSKEMLPAFVKHDNQKNSLIIFFFLFLYICTSEKFHIGENS